jgi:hypothetical protein
MLAFACSAAVLAACQGGSTYAPTTANLNDSSQTALSRWRLPAPFDALTSRMPQTTGCGAPFDRVPGNYISMVAFGSQKGTTFTSAKGLSFWFLSKYTKGTKPTPSPSPGTTPTPTTGPTPKPIKIYLYSGTYATKQTKQGGCAILFVTTSLKPIEKGAGNGIAGGTPQFSLPYVDDVGIATGVLSLKITGLSASGGHGTAVLTTMKGKEYDTATITLTKRVTSIF